MKVEKEQWLSVRKFNAYFLQAMNGCSASVIERVPTTFFSEHNYGFCIIIKINHREEEWVEWFAVPSMTHRRPIYLSGLTRCTSKSCNCCEMIRAFFTQISPTLETNEEKSWYSRETWYPLFLKEIKEHPFFALNAYNPFIVTPRDNASIYLVINTKPL